jgi:hypothetical protein
LPLSFRLLQSSAVASWTWSFAIKETRLSAKYCQDIQLLLLWV